MQKAQSKFPEIKSNFSNSLLYLPMLAVLNLPRAQCDVVLALHSFCNSGNLCYPRQEAIRKRLGGKYKIRRISQILQELKWKGWLTIDRKGWNGNTYTLTIPSGLQFFPDNCPPLQVADPPPGRPKTKRSYRKDTQLKLPLDLPKPLVKIVDVSAKLEIPKPNPEPLKTVSPLLSKQRSPLEIIWDKWFEERKKYNLDYEEAWPSSRIPEAIGIRNSIRADYKSLLRDMTITLQEFESRSELIMQKWDLFQLKTPLYDSLTLWMCHAHKRRKTNEII